LFSLFGILDTAYLTAKHFMAGPIKCVLVEGCDTVTTSAYSLVFGLIPVAVLGLIFYLLVFLGAYLYWEKESLALRWALFALSVAGLLASAWFLYVQAFILSAFCSYCLFSTLTSTLIFIICLSLIYHKTVSIF
jgi:uncharacterized membrane protein